MASFLILLVDDDELSRELVALYLYAEGHRILRAESGDKALEMLDAIGSAIDTATMPDAVLTDMQMPAMTGQQLCRRIRLRTYFKSGQPLLFGMSATRPPEDQLQQFDAFVSKPLDAQAFQKLLVERMARPAPAPVAASTAVETGGDPALDNEIVNKLRKLMPANALEELFATYLSDTRLRLAQMEDAALSGDAAEVRRCAHMMKGSAAMTGAIGIRRAAALLETNTLPLDQQRVLFNEMRCACDAIEGTLARDARNKEAHDHQTS